MRQNKEKNMRQPLKPEQNKKKKIKDKENPSPGRTKLNWEAQQKKADQEPKRESKQEAKETMLNIEP